MSSVESETAAEGEHAGWLRTHRPDLADRFAAALPGARAAVLGRLWGAIVREPLPGNTAAVTGPAEAAEPFAPAPERLTVGGMRHPADLAATLWPDRPSFAAELDNSVANLALARAATKTGTDTDVDAEQSVTDGHPLHPCCRTRTGLTTADVLAYAPEHHPTVELPVIAVPADRWTGTNLPPRLPMHPWQWRHVRDTYPWLRDTGERRSARPLMSLRTLATNDAHLKTAVRIAMTSATRTVSAAAVHNGPALSRLLAPLSTATFGILAERAAGAVLVDGEPCRDLAVIVRDTPTLHPGERALPVAALTAGRPRVDDLTDDPVTFVRDFAGLLLPPLFHLLETGIGLEAHGQNLILVTRGGRPHRLLYRDFGGVRVSPKTLARHGIQAPDLKGDIPSDDPTELETKVLASAVATVLADLVAYLSRRFHTEPQTLWAAIPAPRRLRDRADLPLKAMTAMRLADTVDDIWISVANPLAAR